MAASVSSLMHADLLATCSSLGISDGNTYRKDPECLACLKDILRFLRREDETFEVRRLLGDTKVVCTDLLPLVKHYGDDKTLLDVLLRVLVNLTNPPMLLYREEFPEEKLARNRYMQIVSHLQAYKDGFADAGVWTTLKNSLQALVELDWESRFENDKLMMERILVLIRNVLHVPADIERERRTDEDTSVHDKVVWAMHQSGITDLLIFLASSENDREFCFHVLEIICLMFREQNVEHLASAGAARTTEEKEQDIRKLKEIEMREKMERDKKNRTRMTQRFARFGGTYEVKNVKSISERNLVYHGVPCKGGGLVLGREKVPHRKPKNKRPMEDAIHTRKSSSAVRAFLREFCVDFLQSSYNPLMQAVKDSLSRHRSQAHDETYYLWGVEFFMRFNRLQQGFDVSLVSETVSVHMFHFLQTQLETYYEMLVTDKKKTTYWSRRMHLALKAYKELLMTLGAMDACTDRNVQESSRVIKSNVFYVIEYRDLLLTLLMNFDEVKNSRLYLKDLVETTHVFMKLLERHAKSQRHLIVQARSTARKKNKKKRGTKKDARAEANSTDPDELWAEMSDDLSSVLQGTAGDLPSEVTPFDPASEKSLEEQKMDAMVRIQDCLRQKKAAEAVALFRAARELWPEGDSFGAADIRLEEEFLALREVLFAELPRRAAEEEGEAAQPPEEEAEEEEEERHAAAVQEHEFNFSDFVQRFAHPRVLKAYAHLLSCYSTNAPATNLCLVKMLHRVAWDCKMYGMLFQATVFRTFQRILDEPVVADTAIRELQKLATFVLGKFFELSRTNAKVFVEMLFWKNAKEVYEMQEGYGTYNKRAAPKYTWTEEQEDELQRLYREFKDAGDADKDVVDHILEHLIDANRTRRQVIRQLKQQGLVTSLKQLRPATRVRVPSEWHETEIEELRRLYDQFKEANDIVGQIVLHQTVRRPKHRVIEKLLELGIVAHRKQLHKKRTKKRKEPTPEDDDQSEPDGTENGDGFAEEEEDESASEEEDEDGQVEARPPSAPLERVGTAELKQILEDVIKGGLGSSVQWLIDGLGAAADDWQEGEPQPTPLVPLYSSHSHALEDPLFQRLLRALGMSPPFAQQEMFWRIPSELTEAMIRARVHLLQMACQGRFEEQHLHFLEDRIRAKRKAASPSRREGQPPATKRSRRIVMDEDDEQVDSMPTADGFASDEEGVPSKKKPKRIIDTSDEDD